VSSPKGNGTIGLINAIPYVFGVIAMILWGRHSDRTGERAGHTAIGYAVGAARLIACGLMTDTDLRKFLDTSVSYLRPR
jgi:MFS family permease